MAVSHAQNPAATATRSAVTPLKPSRYRLERESLDGMWHYRRREDSGTSWRVTHLESTGWFVAWSLPQARRDTASGRALREIAHRHPELQHPDIEAARAELAAV